MIVRLLLSYVLLTIGTLSADEAQLNSIEKALIDHQKKTGATFNSTPVNHITPQFNKVTIAFDSEIINTSIESTNSSKRLYEKLQLGGYSFTPYLALSLRNIGVGISGDVGHKSAKYESRLLDASMSSGVSEESFLDYTGLGVYFYYILFKKSKKFRVTVIGGTKLLNVKHQARTLNLNSNGTSTSGSKQGFERIKYTVQKMELGLNMRFQVARSVAIIPWADISVPNTNQVDDLVHHSSLSPTSSHVHNPRRYSADVELFWRNRNELIYGVDVAVKYKSLELHIGSAIGYLSNLNSSVETESEYTIEDSLTLNLGLSYDFKG